MFRVPLTVAMLLVFLGCAKEADDTLPEVRILAPTGSQSYAVGDTIPLQLLARDEHLTKVRISLVNDQYMEVDEALVFPASATSMTLTVDYPVSNRRLESGRHYLRVTAYDERQQASAFFECNIQGIPNRVRYLVAAGRLGTETRLYSIDSTYGGASLRLQQVSDLSDVAVNSWRQRIGLYTSAQGIWHWYNGNFIELDQGSTQGVGGAPYFSRACLDAEGDAVVVTRYDGTVEFWLDAASTTGQRYLPAGYHPTAILPREDRVVVAMQNSNGSQYKLFVLQPVSYQIIREETLPFRVSELLPLGDVCVALGNASGQAQWRVYDPVTFNLYEPLVLPSAAFTAAASGNNRLWLGLTDGVHEFRLNPVGLVPVLPGKAATALCFDEINQEWAVADGQTVDFYNLAGNFGRSVPLVFPITKLQYLNSK